MNAVFLLRERPWTLAEVRDALSSADLVVDDAALGRLVVSEPRHGRVYVGLLSRMHSERPAFGPVKPDGLLELEYASLPLLLRMLDPISVLGNVLIDNDHGFYGPLSELLARKAQNPDWDWRVDRTPQSA